MGKAGGNLNQIARHLNQGGVQTDELRQEIKNCISCIYDMRDEIRKMAGGYRGDHQTSKGTKPAAGRFDSKPAKSVKPVMAPSPSIRLITDLDACIKAQQNRAYAQKVKISNLKEMAKTVNFLKENGIGTSEELSALLSSSCDDLETGRAALKATEGRLKTVNLLIKNSGQYFANKNVYGEYLQAKNKKSFREAHTAELLLYEASRKALKELSDGKPVPSLKQLRAEKKKYPRRRRDEI